MRPATPRPVAPRAPRRPAAPARRRRGPPRGHTLVELLVAVGVLAVLAGAGVRAAAHAADGAAVRAAGAEARSAFAAARAMAERRAERTAVRLDTDAGTVVVHAGPDTLRRLLLAARYGVRLAASRDSAGYSALGLGSGASNLRLVLARGRAADTVTVSRLGRVR